MLSTLISPRGCFKDAVATLFPLELRGNTPNFAPSIVFSTSLLTYTGLNWRWIFQLENFIPQVLMHFLTSKSRQREIHSRCNKKKYFFMTIWNGLWSSNGIWETIWFIWNNHFNFGKNTNMVQTLLAYINDYFNYLNVDRL